jgi:hypothetical protein
MKETWKSIEEFEGLYEISNYGRIKSFQKNKRSGYILKVINSSGWYLSTSLIKDKIRKTYRIHRLVAKAFISNPDNKSQVNHKDGNKQNNNVQNLEWVTPSENIQHAIKFKPSIIAGINHYNQVLKPKKVQQFKITGDFIAEYQNCVVAGSITGVCPRNINQVASKTEYKPGLTRKQAGGYVWKYKGDF